jgi:hypothetical protein
MTALRAAEPELAAQASEGADPAKAPWSADQMLLASLIDAVRAFGWMYAAVHSKDRAPARPEPVERPGIAVRKRKAMTVAAYRAMTGQEPPLHLVQSEGA